MTLIWIAFVLLALTVAVNLLLTLGLIRRIREQPPAVGEVGFIAPLGHRVGDFEVRTVGGTRLDRDAIAPRSTVAFLAPGCEACDVQLPILLAALDADDRREPLVSVVDTDDPDHELVHRLAVYGEVVLVAEGAEIVEAFRVTGFPAYAQYGPQGILGVTSSDASRFLKATRPARALSAA